MNRVSNYAKSIVQIGFAGLAVFASAITDNNVTPLEIVQIVIAFITAGVVYYYPNIPDGAKYKTIVKTLLAGAGAAASALAVIAANIFSFSEVGLSDWLSVILAAGATLGVYIIPNSENVVNGRHEASIATKS